MIRVTSNEISGKRISFKDLKDAQFFQGPHELKTTHLINQYGQNIAAFKTTSEKLGGKPLFMADAAYVFYPFPKIPLYYLFWAGDNDFSPEISILFDQSIESHFSADAIWGLVNFVTDILVQHELRKKLYFAE